MENLFCRIATERQCGLLTESETYSVRSESLHQDFSSIRAWVDYRTLRNRSYDFDGICLTLHSKLDVVKFVEMNDVMLRHKKYRWNDNGFNPDCSLRLNLFADMKALLPKDIDLSMWKVKDMEWVKDCPVPDGEDFRRIKELF